MTADFLSCDWGTSSFRLRLVSSGKVAREIFESIGVRAIFDSGEGPNGFARYLSAKLAELAAGQAIAPMLPLIISGMASSSVGWQELPYARAPFALDGSGLRVEKLDWLAPAWIGPTYLVSGVATETDMMRGEECQILGLLGGARPELSSARERCLVILPGTHSKHVRVENAMVADFHTYMTGELFNVLTQHSLLRATVDSQAQPQKFPDHFIEGAQAAQVPGLARSLFQARARSVLGSRTNAENCAYLSGLLIGSELEEIRETPGLIVLAGNSTLCGLYEMALMAGQGRRTIVGDGDCVVRGHEIILARLAGQL